MGAISDEAKLNWPTVTDCQTIMAKLIRSRLEIDIIRIDCISGALDFVLDDVTHNAIRTPIAIVLVGDKRDFSRPLQIKGTILGGPCALVGTLCGFSYNWRCDNSPVHGIVLGIQSFRDLSVSLWQLDDGVLQRFEQIFGVVLFSARVLAGGYQAD